MQRAGAGSGGGGPQSKRWKATTQNEEDGFRVLCSSVQDLTKKSWLGYRLVELGEVNDGVVGISSGDLREMVASQDRVNLGTEGGGSLGAIGVHHLGFTEETWPELALHTQTGLIHCVGVVEHASSSLIICFYLDRCMLLSSDNSSNSARMSLSLLTALVLLPLQTQETGTATFSVSEMYDAVVERSTLYNDEANIDETQSRCNSYGLKTLLKPYQASGIEWMLRAETETRVLSSASDSTNEHNEQAVLSADGWMEIRSNPPNLINKELAGDLLPFWFNIHTYQLRGTQTQSIVLAKVSVSALFHEVTFLYVLTGRGTCG
jgi:hypothetical protein